MADDEKKEPSVADLKEIASNADAPEDKLQAAAAQAEAALSSYKTASTLREAANAIRDPAKREKYLRDAYDKEIEAHGNSKKARMLQSGAFQGTVGGAGIGAVVAGGLGTVVGTVVGTVTAVPATAVGGLVGAGVGLGHGSWIKLGKLGDGKNGKGKKGQNEEDKEGDGGDENKENEGGDGGQQSEEVDVDDAVPNPEMLRQAAEDIKKERERGSLDTEGGAEVEKEKRKPRKLSRQESEQGQPKEQKTEKRKPRKIEVRSSKPEAAAV
ncbi:uncharacterized protein EKO05_0003673 [Ascochyta rabiei]|uniref:Uncharacterized protein n=1 Tax=Didymella rabiei TaxID=5454 RepID=A0A162YWX4_DIDRA|nr:uncharacterized protein EKO05_0003673 [Ascochyta rabiei]KZM20276.1 hypothetical protein ST47_g8595 [Ascochyta rabiei]UPX13147.1 hypothetical protein EKO05_0003673 [Ascochyta rabiei]